MPAGPASGSFVRVAISASSVIATRRPSRFAPSDTRWIVPGRLPASLCSASRSFTQRTGRLAARASNAATSAFVLAPVFAPKPPPMCSSSTRTCVCGRSNARARSSRVWKMPCVDSHTVSRPPTHSATAAWGSSAEWRAVGVRYSRAIMTSARSSAAAASPRSVICGSLRRSWPESASSAVTACAARSYRVDDRRERALRVARRIGAHCGQRLSGVVDIGREESPAG